MTFHNVHVSFGPLPQSYRQIPGEVAACSRESVCFPLVTEGNGGRYDGEFCHSRQSLVSQVGSAVERPSFPWLAADVSDQTEPGGDADGFQR